MSPVRMSAVCKEEPVSSVKGAPVASLRLASMLWLFTADGVLLIAGRCSHGGFEACLLAGLV